MKHDILNRFDVGTSFEDITSKINIGAINLRLKMKVTWFYLFRKKVEANDSAQDEMSEGLNYYLNKCFEWLKVRFVEAFRKYLGWCSGNMFLRFSSRTITKVFNVCNECWNRKSSCRNIT